MKKREYGDYIEDILDSIDAIEEFVKGMNFEEFKKNKKTVYAVVRAIEIIGEAAKNIPQTVKEKHPKIPWKDMAAMRDKVIHEYFGVDKQVVWETIKHDIPNIKSPIKKILDDLGE